MCRSLRVLIVTAVENVYHARVAAKLGIQGYVRKTASLSTVVDAIRSVASGATAYEWTAARFRETGYDFLTEREQEVLELIAIGCRNAEVAERLYVSIKHG